MPFCDISPDVSLHYITNTTRGDVTDLDNAKATILLVSPMLSDLTWLREEFKDPRLSNQYNLVAIDQRNVGQTRAPLSPLRDTWVDAADLAVAHELLRLPPCHMFSVSLNGCGALLRLAMIFPEKCLSLCLCSAPCQPRESPEWVQQGYYDLVQARCFPKDLDDVERACMEGGWYAFGGQISRELEDEYIAWCQINQPPTRRTSFLAQALPALHRYQLTNKELASIKQPTMFFHGDKTPHNPPSTAYNISSKMPNSQVFVVRGAPELMNIVPEYASVVHRVYCHFLENIPNPPALNFKQPDPERVCREGLKRLAFFADDPSVARRDPRNTTSFCLFAADVIQNNIAMFAEFSKGQEDAYDGLNEHGQPIRKFSERTLEQWTPAAFRRFHAANLGVVTVELSTVSVYDSEPSPVSL